VTLTLGCPIAALPKPAEASANRKMIDNFPGPAILLGPEKRWLESYSGILMVDGKQLAIPVEASCLATILCRG
jgi:hypothetical protein